MASPASSEPGAPAPRATDGAWTSAPAMRSGTDDSSGKRSRCATISQRTTAAVDVAGARRVAEEVLRRHVAALALHHAFGRDVGAPRRLGDPEVEEARGAVLADQDVLRGDVAVHEAERLAVVPLRLVGRVQAVEDLDHEARGDPERHRLARLRGAPQQQGQREPEDVLEDEEDLAAGGDDVERRHHVGVVDARARRASSRNAVTKSTSSARCGCSRLIATIRRNPPLAKRRPRCTVPIPPEPIFSWRR